MNRIVPDSRFLIFFFPILIPHFVTISYSKPLVPASPGLPDPSSDPLPKYGFVLGLLAPAYPFLRWPQHTPGLEWDNGLGWVRRRLEDWEARWISWWLDKQNIVGTMGDVFVYGMYGIEDKFWKHVHKKVWTVIENYRKIPFWPASIYFLIKPSTQPDHGRYNLLDEVTPAEGGAVLQEASGW